MSNLFPPQERLSPQRQALIRGVVFAEIAGRGGLGARVRRPRRRWAVGLATAGTSLSGLVVFLLTLGGSTPALAAWTAVPEHVPAGRAARLGASCERDLAAGHFPTGLGSPTSALAERRGAGTAVLLVGASGAEAICVNPAPSTAEASAGPLVGIDTPGRSRGPLTVDGLPGGPGLGDSAVYGRVADWVDKVLVTTQDGRLVTATLGDGYFLAWWPSGAGVTAIRVLGSAGHLITTVRNPGGDGSAPPVPRHQ
jgi:hypothetical protein